MSASSRPANRLGEETSPYLLQHAFNPVDWYPWGTEALARARREDRPILLSVGYSACHWCHVMERESFENDAIANLMNSLFVNIKVDREERPDLDRIYQLAHQLLTRRPGGWPLTAFLTPIDHAPLFVGTYFPAEPHHGMPGFGDLLQQVAQHYTNNRSQMGDHAKAIRQALQQTEPSYQHSTEPADTITLETAARQLEDEFDAVHGGFGKAPKFPHPTHLSLLLRLAWSQKSAQGSAYQMTIKTLGAMASGGLWDHVTGGFYRYAVDDQWRIPHFEKMLYDNAQLLPIFADAHALWGREDFGKVARGTAAWVINEMQSVEGGYFSTIDADSEGVEGRYYVWDATELKDILDPKAWCFASALFGLTNTPNFEGRWHFNQVMTPAEAGQTLNLCATEAEQLWHEIRETLRLRREARIRPDRDEKILTAWNGLMITGMARAGRRLGEPKLVDSAQAAVDFITEQLWDGQRLLATARAGKAHLNAYLDDYVYLANGLLELLQARWRTQDLYLACQLLDTLLTHFRDAGSHAFYFTSDDHETLLHRPRPLMDDAIPSGNAVAARALLAFGHLTGNENYVVAAEQLLRELVPACTRYPAGASALLEAEDDRLGEMEIIVIRGKADTIMRWATPLHREYHPRRLIFAIDENTHDLPTLLATRSTQEEPVAYVCRGFECSAPLIGEHAFEAWKQSIAGEATRS